MLGRRSTCKSSVSMIQLEIGGGARNTHTPPIANGPADHAPGIAFSTNLEGENLSRVQPWYREPSSSEDGRVKEDEECGGTADLRAAAAVACIHGSSGKTAGGEHAYALTGGAPVESPAATDPVQGEDTNERGKLWETSVSHSEE